MQIPDVPHVSQETKDRAITNVKAGFENLRFAIDTLSTDIESTDMKLQTSAIWMSGEMLRVYSELFSHFKNLEKDVIQMQENMKEALESEKDSGLLNESNASLM